MFRTSDLLSVYRFLRFFATGRINSTTSGISKPIFSSMISSKAMSAAPKCPVSATNGRLILPPPEVSWRTRRESRLTRTLGLPTFSSAFFVNSAFKAQVFEIERYTNCFGLERNINILNALALECGFP